MKKEKINFVIVGPEQPLVDGIVDYLEKFNIKTFGPNKIASQLEGSKIFTKKLCEKFNIPTAKFGIFYNKLDAKKFTETMNFPTVIKADNLASGKGDYICNNIKETNKAIDEISRWIEDGKILINEDIYEGIDNFRSIFLKLFNGDKMGKLILKI